MPGARTCFKQPLYLVHGARTWRRAGFVPALSPGSVQSSPASWRALRLLRAPPSVSAA